MVFERVGILLSSLKYSSPEALIMPPIAPNTRATPMFARRRLLCHDYDRITIMFSDFTKPNEGRRA